MLAFEGILQRSRAGYFYEVFGRAYGYAARRLTVPTVCFSDGLKIDSLIHARRQTLPIRYPIFCRSSFLRVPKLVASRRAKGVELELMQES